jgi:hypothetical protein
MKVAGITFIRNAIKYDYPVVESITSILPLVDEMIVVAGNSEDATNELIDRINSPKIRRIDSVWDDALREGGRVLAEETNKALDAVAPDCDWVFYIQADEVLHEQYHEHLKDLMRKELNNSNTEGILFNYLHFYGHYYYVGDSRRWYDHEIRIVRNNKHVRSFRDAQGFRWKGRLLKVKASQACMHHYGWVKNPKVQKQKEKDFNKLWHSDEKLSQMIVQANEYDYSSIDSLTVFTGKHPAVMEKRIAAADWKFEYDVSKKKLKLKDRVLSILERLTGRKLFRYKNYRLL